MPNQANIAYVGLGECWEWKGTVDASGYGVFHVNGKNYKAHRVSWTLANGQIQHNGTHHGICVCHRCDNPACVRPSHLKLGTPKSNSTEMVERGRSARGETHPARLHPELMARGSANGNSKLEDEQVKEIRALYAAGGTSYRKLGVQFGVSRVTVGRTIKLKNWQHVSP